MSTIDIGNKPIVHSSKDVLNHYDVSRRLKSLNVTASKLRSNVKRCKMAIAQNEGDMKDQSAQLKEIEAELALIENNGELIVTEHALLRYLERYKNIDLNDIVQEIRELPPERVVNKGTTIVTIVEENMETYR